MASLNTPQTRWVGVVLCLIVLAGLCLWMGALSPDPDRYHYPDQGDLASEYDAYIGQQATVSGTVIDTDPIVIRTGEGLQLTITDVDRDIDEGAHFRAFGVVEPEQTLNADATLSRAAWETTYMYVISALAGVWMLARFIRGWRSSTREWAFVPRHSHSSSHVSTTDHVTPTQEDHDG